MINNTKLISEKEKKGSLMEDHSAEHLRIMGRLALEYQQKFSELEELTAQSTPDAFIHQLSARAEVTTDKFRAAQLVLLSLTAPDSGKEPGETLKGAMALCRCFDEMRILFQFLLDRYSTDRKESN